MTRRTNAPSSDGRRHSQPAHRQASHRPARLLASLVAGWLAAAVAGARRVFAGSRNWRIPRVAAVTTVIAATVLVPLSLASPGGVKQAPASGPRSVRLHGASLTSAGASVDTGPLSLSETILPSGSSSDSLCGTPTSTGLLGDGSEVCYQVTVGDSGTNTAATGATLNLSFVDGTGAASTEEQFRTQSLSGSQVAAPASVTGFSNDFTITASDTGTANTATQTSGTSSSPAPGGTGLNTLSLSLGNENPSGPYTIDVAGVLNDISTGTPAPVYLSASLDYNYTKGTSSTPAASTCDQSTSKASPNPCALEVTPAVPDLSVNKSITTSMPTSGLAQTGDVLNYQVVISNPSVGVTAYHVGLCDTVGANNVSGQATMTTTTGGKTSAPANVTLTKCPTTGGTAVSGTTDQGLAGTGTIAPGDSETFTYSITVDATSCDLTPAPTATNFCNIAVADWQSAPATVSTDLASGSPPVPVVSATQGSQSLLVVGGPGISDSVGASVTGSDPPFDAGSNYSVLPGETLTYTITVDVPQGGLSSFTVKDTLPSLLDATTVAGTGATAYPPGNGNSGSSGSDAAALDSAAKSPTTSGSVVTFSFPTVDNTDTKADPFTFAFTVKAAAVATLPTAGPATDQAQLTAWTTPNGTSHSPTPPPSASAQDIQVVTLPTMAVARLSGSAASGFDPSCATDTTTQLPEGTEVCYQVTINPASANLSGASLKLEFASSDSAVREQFDTQTVKGTTDVPAPFSQTGTSNDGTVSASGSTVTGNAPPAVASDGSLTLTLGSVTTGATPAVVDVAGVLTGAAVNTATPASVALDATLTSSYTLAGGSASGATTFDPTGSDSPPVTPIAPTVTVTKAITNDTVTPPAKVPVAIQSDVIDYQVTITNTSPATDPATAHNLGFCDSLASSTGLSSGTSATYTYTAKGSSTGTQTTAASIPACGADGSGVLNNVAGAPTYLAPGDAETITYSLTLPAPPSTTCGQNSVNFCNSGVAEWQIPPTLPSTTTAEPAGDTLTPSTSGTASLLIAAAPSVTGTADVTTGSLVTIGQKIDYSYTLTVPNGGLKNVNIVATLPVGVGVAADSGAKLLGGSVDSSGDLTGTPFDNAVKSATVGASGAGANDNQVTFSFGNITNNSGGNQKLIVDFPAWVLDTAGNQGSPPAATATALDSSGVVVSFDTTNKTTHTVSTTFPNFTVAEPDVTVAQTVAPQGDSTLPAVVDVNDHLLISDVVTNTGASDAYGTEVTTSIPAGFSDATLTSTNATAGANPPGGDFVFDIAHLTPGESEIVTWSILADRPVTLGTGSTSSVGAPVATWSSLASAPAPPAGNTDTSIAADTDDTTTGSTADVGLTSPAITTPGASATTVQIGQRFTYSVSFVVPATGAKGVVLTSTLAPGLAYATGAGGSTTCTAGGNNVVSTGCVTISPAPGAPAGSTLSAASVAALAALALPAPSGSQLAVSLGDLSYPASASVASPAPTVEVTVSYDVYATDVPSNSSPDTVALPSTDTASVTYKTVPGGAASTPLNSDAAGLTIVNPQLTDPSITIAPTHAEVGVVNPGPALVQVTATVASPSNPSTAYATTLSVTLPAGLLAVNGNAENGVTGAMGAPTCTGGTGKCQIGSGATKGTVTGFTNKGGAPPTTCTASDPAVAGSTVVAVLDQLKTADTSDKSMQLSFDACVVPGTIFGTGSAQNVAASVTWFSQAPPAPPALAAHQYPALSSLGNVDFTGTSVNMALASTNDGTSAGYTIGDTVSYGVTVGLPESVDASLTPPTDPAAGTPETLPAFSVCAFLPAGLAYSDSTPQTPANVGTGIVSATLPTPAVATSNFKDSSCPSQLAAQPKGTTMVEFDYPAGTQVYYNGQYGTDSFVQRFDVTVGPDPASSGIARGTTETAAASVGVSGRTQTQLSAANAFVVTEPELKIAQTVTTTSLQNSPFTTTVTLTNDNSDGLAAPSYSNHLVVTAPASTTTALFPKSVSVSDGSPAAAWAAQTTNSATGTGNDTIDYTPAPATTASPTPPEQIVKPGATVTITYTSRIGQLVLNGQTIDLAASLVKATSQAGTTLGRVYSSTATGPSLVPPVSSVITVIGPTAGLKTVVTGPVGTVAPGSTPTYTISVTNLGKVTLTELNLQLGTNPAMTDLLATAASNSGSYTQSTGDWSGLSLAPNATATVTATGTVPQDARGTMTLSAAATTSPATTGVAQDTSVANGKGSYTNSLQVAVDASVKISAQGSLHSGQRATYLITVANAGPSAAGNITLTETPPPGTGFVDTSGSGWSCGQSFPLTCTFAGPLAAHHSTQLTTDLVVDVATGQIMTNTARVSTAADTNPANNVATTSNLVLPALTNSAAGSGGNQVATAGPSQPQTVSSGGGGGSSSSSKALAFTGDNEVGQGTFALAVIAAGALLLLVSRRRRPAHSTGERRSRR